MDNNCTWMDNGNTLTPSLGVKLGECGNLMFGYIHIDSGLHLYIRCQNFSRTSQLSDMYHLSRLWRCCQLLKSYYRLNQMYVSAAFVIQRQNIFSEAEKLRTKLILLFQKNSSAKRRWRCNLWIFHLSIHPLLWQGWSVSVSLIWRL